MGSRGTKRSRKRGRAGVRTQQRRQRQAIADTMGFGRAPAWVKWTAILAVAAMIGGGVVSLVALA